MIRYFIILDYDGQTVAEGNFYEILHELKWSAQTFYNSLRPIKRNLRNSLRVFEIVPDEGLDEFRAYYDCLLRIKDLKIKKERVKSVAEACQQYGYDEVLTKQKQVLVGVVSYERSNYWGELSRASRAMAKNLILFTYGLITISEDLSLEEISEYYHVPLWLVEMIDFHYYEIFMENKK